MICRKFSTIILPLAALAAPVHAAPETVTPAQAACDEQAGEFHRAGGVASCLIDGIVYSTIEPASRAAKPCLESSPTQSAAVPLTLEIAAAAVIAPTPRHC